MTLITAATRGLAVIAAAATSSGVTNLFIGPAHADSTGISTTDLHCSATATEFTASYEVTNHSANAVTLQPDFAINGSGVVAGAFAEVRVPGHAHVMESAAAAAPYLDFNPNADQCEVNLSQVG
jgi:hypothetical protein